jgi:hypothetical protein
MLRHHLKKNIREDSYPKSEPSGMDDVAILQYYLL